MIVSVDTERLPWRCGVGDGRDVFVVLYGYASDSDRRVGRCISPEAAARVVEQHNLALALSAGSAAPDSRVCADCDELRRAAGEVLRIADRSTAPFNRLRELLGA